MKERIYQIYKKILINTLFLCIICISCSYIAFAEEVSLENTDDIYNENIDINTDETLNEVQSQETNITETMNYVATQPVEDVVFIDSYGNELEVPVGYDGPVMVWNEEVDAPDVVVYRQITAFHDPTEIFNAIEGFVSESENSLTQRQKDILHAAANTPNAPAGYCALWVGTVFGNAGYEVSGNANDLWAQYCTSDNREDLQPGMIVAVQQSNANPSSLGYKYGHVAIYVGNGLVVDSTSTNGNGVKTLNYLDDWLGAYDVFNTGKWGFPPAVQHDMSREEGLSEQLLHVKTTNEGVELIWNQDSHADGYLVYKDRTIIANIHENLENEYLDTDVLSDIPYTYTVISYSAKPSSIIGETSQVSNSECIVLSSNPDVQTESQTVLVY